MRDQRIETGAALGFEDARHRGAVGGVGGKAVNRLCRNTYRFTVLQQRQRLAIALFVGRISTTGH